MTSLTNELLKVCSVNPVTGYNRDGYCRNLPDDSGIIPSSGRDTSADASISDTHVVCAKMTDEFLKFTKTRGNDLMTAQPGFPGLKSGQKWCVCANRWNEAANANKAPLVDLQASNKSALKFNTLKTYRKYSLRSGGKRRTPKRLRNKTMKNMRKY